jgi:hypothetical protein
MYSTSSLTMKIIPKFRPALLWLISGGPVTASAGIVYNPVVTQYLVGKRQPEVVGTRIKFSRIQW